MSHAATSRNLTELARGGEGAKFKLDGDFENFVPNEKLGELFTKTLFLDF